MEGRVWGETSSSVFHKEIHGKYSVGVHIEKTSLYMFSDIRLQVFGCEKRQDGKILWFRIFKILALLDSMTKIFARVQQLRGEARGVGGGAARKLDSSPRRIFRAQK